MPSSLFPAARGKWRMPARRASLCAAREIFRRNIFLPSGEDAPISRSYMQISVTRREATRAIPARIAKPQLEFAGETYRPLAHSRRVSLCARGERCGGFLHFSLSYEFFSVLLRFWSRGNKLSVYIDGLSVGRLSVYISC